MDIDKLEIFVNSIKKCEQICDGLLTSLKSQLTHTHVVESLIRYRDIYEKMLESRINAGDETILKTRIDLSKTILRHLNIIDKHEDIATVRKSNMGFAKGVMQDAWKNLTDEVIVIESPEYGWDLANDYLDRHGA